MLDKHSWPASLAHLKGPCAVHDTVLVGLVSSDPEGPYYGFVRLHTALVPLADVDKVLQAPGGIGQEVRCWGPHPTPHKGQQYKASFWVDGAQQDVEYEALVNTWRVNDREILLPDNGFLMCYGLVPRVLHDGTICWDDPRGPVFDVVVVHPTSQYRMPSHTKASITIQRRYLEDYLSLKQCAAVAVFYEERFSRDGSQFDALVGKDGWAHANLPGRELWLRRIDDDPFDRGEQHSSISGCRLLLKPATRPITD